MKRKLIKNKESHPYIEINQASYKDYYFGVLYGLGNEHKGMVTRESYDGGKFYVLATRNVTNGNSSTLSRMEDFEDFLENILENYGEVFVFDTSKELFAWLAE